MRLSLTAGSLTLSLLLCGVVRAAPQDDVESLIHQGIELRRKGQDTRAEGYFRRAHDLAPTPRTTAQLGLVELAVKEYLEAEGHLSEALSNKDSWIAENRKALEDSRDLARKFLMRVELSGAPKGTTFEFEGAESRAVPKDGLIWLAPSAAALVHLEAPGHKPATLRVGGAAGDKQRIMVDMPETADATKGADASRTVTLPGAVSPPIVNPPPIVPPPPSAEPAPGRALRIAGIATAAVGVVGAVVGAVVLSKGLSKRDAIRADANNTPPRPFNLANQNWESLRDAGLVTIIGGGVAVVGGVGLYFLGTRAAHEDGASVSFVPSSGCGVFSYRGSF
ncbi:MAG: hypothetical protein JWM82_1656 [Myxococcales bacterium]|nr:hypothetical protein [Myxococcales bacterium]